MTFWIRQNYGDSKKDLWLKGVWERKYRSFIGK
jgi:hypothetical protein